ncbi:flagellar motor switch protein FliG [Inmirania thermothiophila]|uniref:Flagellar motor switch protein FliG n=1 Tax=Inmirania thermothiophila TaxID=1750597 RepID=A0A3N1Y850_9GAMM|nr:flagellar motor switch protein FliG [Inmirania thermothiophila]
MSGAQRAAVLLMTLGERAAAEVLRHLGPHEVQQVGQAMAELGGVTREQVQGVLEAFVQGVEKHTALGVGKEEYLRTVLVEALGPERAGAVLERILQGVSGKGLDALRWLDPRAIAGLIRNEHPQIQAIVLSYLEAETAAQVLALLPQHVRAEVVMRVATMDTVPSEALQELDAIVEQSVSRGLARGGSALGGLRRAADLVNLLDAETEGAVMEALKESDADLAQQIEEQMFVFENLMDVDDRGIQMLLREINTETLVVALKGADEALQEKIFRNMSKRAAEMLRDDLEVRGPVRVSEVEAAQKEILAVARRLAEEGQIMLGKGDEFV